MYGSGGSFYGVGTPGVAGVAGANGPAGANGAAGVAGVAGAAGVPAPTAVATGTRNSGELTAVALTVVTPAANSIRYMRFKHTITNAYTAMEASSTVAGAGGTRLTLCLFRSTANHPAGLVWYSAPIAADAVAPAAFSATFATGTKVIAAEFVGNNFTPLFTEYWLAMWNEAAVTVRASALAASPILNFGTAPWGLNDAVVYFITTPVAWIVGAPPDPAAASTGQLTIPVAIALVAA